MFILKRQDVKISSIQDPHQDRQIPILSYQQQSFRLIKVFKASQEEEAVAFWRDLTDNQGKGCVLLEEPERFSVWGKILLSQLSNAAENEKGSLIQGCLLLLQAVYIEIEDLLGSRQAKLFQKDITEIFRQRRFPQADSPSTLNYLFTMDPMTDPKIPPWQEPQLITLLQELHRLGKEYFGNTNFVNQVTPTLEDLPEIERSGFIQWLKQSALDKLWQ